MFIWHLSLSQISDIVYLCKNMFISILCSLSLLKRLNASKLHAEIFTANYFTAIRTRNRFCFKKFHSEINRIKSRKVKNKDSWHFVLNQFQGRIICGYYLSDYNALAESRITHETCITAHTKQTVQMLMVYQNNINN